MIPKFYQVAFILLLCGACGQSKKKISTKDKFDALEKLVSTANWQVVDNTDTSYIYFSRIGSELFNVYNYTLKNGDSSNSSMNVIAGKSDSVIWYRNNENIYLVSIDEKTAEWKEIINGKTYLLNKQDSIHNLIKYPDGHASMMTKTLPLATFLVRSKYDYMNGTRTVDSPIVMPRHPLN